MSSSPEKILILESDEKHAALLTQYIRMMGFEPRALGNGADGLELLQEWTPDLVLTELDLPGVTGMNVLKRIKENPATREIPVVAMSSQKDEEVIVVTLSSGAADFLVKPILMAELTPKLQHALEIKRYRAELRLANERLEKEKKGLSRFFSEDVAGRIISGEIGTDLGGASLEATIMFCDLRNSTWLGERLSPVQFAEFLSEVLGRFMQLIFTHQGSVNKLLGDGILATFGCPVSTDHDARNCARTALAIREAMRDYNSNRPAYIPDEVRMGIGIASGRVFAGNVGSDQRLEYTVVGDPVNLAARLEKLNKRLGTDILVCETTRARFGPEFETGPGTEGHVRGKTESVRFFHLIAER